MKSFVDSPALDLGIESFNGALSMKPVLSAPIIPADRPKVAEKNNSFEERKVDDTRKK